MIRRFALAWLMFSLAAVSAAPAADSFTVLFGDGVHRIEGASVDGGHLWLPSAALPEATGFALKARGLCRADTCVPLPAGASLTRGEGAAQLVDATAVAALLDQAVVADLEKGVWSFGEALAGGGGLSSGLAPDFAVPDRQGNLVHLSQFRGKKVMVLTWASWCGCSLDLPEWQKIYAELKDKNFELVAAAQDTGGEAAAGKFYDKAKATYTTLIDTTHAVSSAFQMVNVPTAVWIDEQGHIVRPPEVAYTKQMNVFGQRIGDDRYVPALRDWVEKGPKSRYVVTSEQLSAKLKPRSLTLRQGDAEFKLGAYFHAAGDKELARKHWKAAQELNPADWNYHRQDWTFNGGEAITKWLAKVRELNGRPYYDPAEFPAEEK